MTDVTTRSQRIERLRRGLDIVRDGRIPVSIQKARLLTESFKASEGHTTVERCARAFQHILQNTIIRIEPEELIVGNPATRAWGVELSPLWATWPDDEIDSLEVEGYALDSDLRELLPEINQYWASRCLTARMTELYDDQRLWPFAQSGVVLPPFRSRQEGWGPGGLLGSGYGVWHEISQMIGTPDYEQVLTRGLLAILADVNEEITQTRVTSAENVRKLDQLRASRRALEAVMEFADRFALLASAQAETAPDEEERNRLLEIAAVCRTVPHHPASTLREALQSYWFLYVAMMPSGTLGMGRLDQLFIPWYCADKEHGRIDDQYALDLFSCLRIRSMEITVQGGTAHRSKWAGGAKWHNAIIGGQLADGSDATNELSYLILEAARVCPTPHHTITMRVHPGTPDRLLQAGIEVAAMGAGMPAFVSDESVLDYFRDQGILTEDAREYNVAGSLSVNLPARSRMIASPMFVLPKVLAIAIKGGEGEPSAPRTRPLREHTSFEDFYREFHVHLEHYAKLQGEFNNVTIRSIAERFPRPLDSVLMDGGITSGEDVLMRTFGYENSNLVNPVGVINVADSLAAIRSLVFQSQEVTGAELEAALDADWQGEYARLRSRAQAVAKFGNDDDGVDDLAVRLYRDLAAAIRTVSTVTGGTAKPSALTIGTSPWPGGAVTGAGPDGRSSADPLAEESMTPMRWSERAGPWAVLRSAVKINQREYQSTELDMRFEASAVATREGRANLADFIRTYFSHGGKHVQFNIADTTALRRLRTHRSKSADGDLMVRLGGTTAYFGQISGSLADELLKRHYFDELPPRPADLELGSGWT